MTAWADFEQVESEGGTVLRFTGDLTLARLGDLPRRLDRFAGEVARIDLSHVERVDTVGAWVIHRFADEHGAEVVGLEPDEAHLFEQVTAADQPIVEHPGQLGLFPRI